jgi:hypothetical protein
MAAGPEEVTEMELQQQPPPRGTLADIRERLQTGYPESHFVLTPVFSTGEQGPPVEMGIDVYVKWFQWRLLRWRGGWTLAELRSDFSRAYASIRHETPQHPFIAWLRDTLTKLDLLNSEFR